MGVQKDSVVKSNAEKVQEWYENEREDGLRDVKLFTVPFVSTDATCAGILAMNDAIEQERYSPFNDRG